MIDSAFRSTMVGAMLLAAATFSSHIGRAEAAGTPGCGKTRYSGYQGALDGNHQIQSGGRARNYGMYVPDRYNDDTNRPRKLIVDFHGNGGSPKDQYENSQYYKYPQGREYLVAYPLGINNSWQGAPYATPNVDDLRFTSDLVAHIRNNYCVDPQRIYASGKSNGGDFVDLLACSNNGNEFAAFAMAAPALYTDNEPSPCGGARPRKIIHAHGFKDDVIKYDGGPRQGERTPAINQWLEWWSDRNGCTDRQESFESNGYKKIVYSSCNGIKNVVQHYGIYNLGHCWPDDRTDNTDGARADCKDQSLDFTSKVLDFFAARSL